MSAPTVATGIDGVRALPRGEVLGESGPVTVTQHDVDLFAQATGDHQWIHVDPRRAAGTPFGGTIAHGYLTLSLVPRLLPEILRLDGFSMVVNYGCEKVRFPSPVPTGSTLRATAVLDEVTEVTGGLQVTITMTITVEGATKPACVVTFLTRHLV
ncbi:MULTISPECIES: MaoC family dehydratase [Pseudonocardia]|uniref:MaoC family dehydratase n=2 Tax=Pseudonocardia TaxID=1847 RepID=A0ABQ0S068_9PSEU|nr:MULTISPECIES: MaoC family dehydratase [Pseudonocardia]OSY40166.1 putative enoyl-CoA hydratase 1 [Pseudonocardia autotrophica]TDN72890.1 acyl dehydratase [Pseudonocardia autotrophica]BBG03608.1 MaoC family dehydratase [Pseudonocardia autotrophica]GEC26306.1 MaoC family dehydratase [Pseudonocardia saturnea]